MYYDKAIIIVLLIALNFHVQTLPNLGYVIVNGPIKKRRN